MTTKQDMKRTRTKNFSEQEKQLLITLITPYKHVIENIKTDGFNIKQKNQSWAVITSQFNDRVESGSRTVQQLKTLYDMIKRQTKKNLSNEKVIMYKIMKQITHEEQCLIVDLVQSHHSELFTGRPYEQEEAWINICETYNLHQTTGPRVMEELKFIFDHLTKAAKIENRTDKIERYKTGGGTYTKSMTSISEQILGVITERTEPLVNKFDDDVSYSTTDIRNTYPMDADKCIENDVEIVEFIDGVEEIDMTADNLLLPSRELNCALFNTEPETSTLSKNSYQSPARNESNQIKTTKDTAVKKGSLQKSVCDGLQELAKKKINKVCAEQKFSQDIQDLKIKKAKTELEAAETTLEIVKTELALKK